jgi:hypothetical protein
MGELDMLQIVNGTNETSKGRGASVPIRCPQKITITGCRPLNGEAFYCLKRSAVYQLGIVFPAARNRTSFSARWRPYAGWRRLLTRAAEIFWTWEAVVSRYSARPWSPLEREFASNRTQPRGLAGPHHQTAQEGVNL